MRPGLLVGTALAAAPALAGPASWRIAEAPHVTVVSQWGDAGTAAWAGEFEAFTAALGRVIRVDERRLPPLTVVLMNREADFQAYDPILENGQVLLEDGFFGRRLDWAVVGLYAHADFENTRHVVLHEGVHWYLSAYPLPRPLAIEEGLAEVFSTFRTDGSGLGRFGAVVPADLALARRSPLLPVEQLLAVTRYDPLAARHGIGIFYAESWAFVHYLMFGGDAPGLAGLDRLLAAFGRGLPPRAALREALGLSPEELDRRLFRYLLVGTYRTESIRLGALAAPPASVPAPPAAVEIALAKLAAVSPGRMALALRHADRAIGLDPSDAEAYELAAYARRELLLTAEPGP